MQDATNSELVEIKAELTEKMMKAVAESRLDEAEHQLENLREMSSLSPDHPDVLTFRVLIDIQRGQAVDALCHLNSLPADHCPELKVVCMYAIGDPLWQGLAHELADNSPHEHVRQSMKHFVAQSLMVR